MDTTLASAIPFDRAGEGAAGRGRFPNASRRDRKFTGSSGPSKPAERSALLQKIGVKPRDRLRVCRVRPATVRIGTARCSSTERQRYLEPFGCALITRAPRQALKEPQARRMMTRIEATDDTKSGRRVQRRQEASRTRRLHFLFQADGVFGMSTRIDYTPRPDETQWLYPLGIKG